MYIAAKYEEMCPPALDEFSFITDNTYEMKHILRMEQIVMKVSTVCATCDDDRRRRHYLVSFRCSISLSRDRPVTPFCNII
jgi:hypothetical protein